MKNKILLCCTFFISIALYCSEQPSRLHEVKQFDPLSIKEKFHNVYVTYACICLEEYKTADYTPEKMGDIVKMNQYMTGNTFFPYNTIRDESGNNFIRVAVKKMDLPIVDWLVTKLGVNCITKEDFNYCTELCIKQLSPKKTEKSVAEENIAYNIFKILTEKQSGPSLLYVLHDKPCREHLIKQLILLQIKHKRYQSNFPINEKLIEKFVISDNADQSPIILKDMYQNVSNKKGNTLSHIIVKWNNADELFQLINKDYVSSVPNKRGRRLVDIALDNFQFFVQDGAQSNKCPDESKHACCCLFMLLNYITKKFNKYKGCEEYVIKCCEQHVIK